MFKGSFRRKVLGVIALLSFNAVASAQPVFRNQYPNRSEDPRNPVGPPLTSLLLPGFDQWWEGQYPEAAFYTGYGLAGLGLAANADGEVHDTDDVELDTRDNRERQFILGTQMYLFAGEMSAYQSFRSTVETHRWTGKFGFIQHDETAPELFMAPWDFHFLTRPTTFVPLGILVGLVSSDISGDKAARKYLDGSDIGYSTAFSVQAGVGEEAMFRGYMMPLFRQRWASDQAANVATATIFGLAHASSENKVPIAQALAGYYFGYLTIKNGWSVREAIFVHTWWDIIVFTGEYLAQSNAERSVFIPLHLAYF